MLTWKEAPFFGHEFSGVEITERKKAGRIVQIKTDKIITISTPNVLIGIKYRCFCDDSTDIKALDGKLRSDRRNMIAFIKSAGSCRLERAPAVTQ